MKKFLPLFSFVIAIVILIGGLYLYFNNKKDILGAAQKTATIGKVYLGDNEATSSVTYLFPYDSNRFVASTTWSFNASRVDEDNRNIIVQVKASTTDSILKWHWESSNDNIAWYRENISTTTSEIYSDGVQFVNVMKPMLYQRNWSGPASSTMVSTEQWDTSFVNYFAIPVPKIAANHLRLTIWEDGLTSSTVWAAIQYRDISQ